MYSQEEADLLRERDQLRAEVERLRGVVNDMGALLADVRKQSDDATARAEAAEAHAADLRRALEKIAEMDWANAATNAMGYRANKVATSAIARTPSQSLAAIEGRVLREAAERVDQKCCDCHDEVRMDLLAAATRREEAAK